MITKLRMGGMVSQRTSMNSVRCMRTKYNILFEKAIKQNDESCNEI